MSEVRLLRAQGERCCEGLTPLSCPGGSGPNRGPLPRSASPAGTHGGSLPGSSRLCPISSLVGTKRGLGQTPFLSWLPPVLKAEPRLGVCAPPPSTQQSHLALCCPPDSSHRATKTTWRPQATRPGPWRAHRGQFSRPQGVGLASRGPPRCSTWKPPGHLCRSQPRKPVPQSVTEARPLRSQPPQPLTPPGRASHGSASSHLAQEWPHPEPPGHRVGAQERAGPGACLLLRKQL